MSTRLTTHQAAEHFAVSHRTIHRFLRNGKLFAAQVEGRWVIELNGEGVTEGAPDVKDGAHDDVKGNGHAVNDDAHLNSHRKRGTVEHEQLSKHFDAQQSQIQHQLRQLAEKDTQLARRDTQLDALTQQLDHLTQVVAMAQKNVSMLTEQLGTERQLIEDMRSRKPFWRRWFRRDALRH